MGFTLDGRWLAALLFLIFGGASCDAIDVPKTDLPSSPVENAKLSLPTRIGEKDSPPEAIRLYNLAQEKIKEDDYEAAQNFLQQAVKAQPNLVPAWFALGRAYEKQKKNVPATRAYREVLRLQPGHVQSQFALGRLAQKDGNVEQAIYRYEEAVRLDPNSFLVHYRLGLVRRKRGQLSLAIYHFRNAVRLSPENLAARYWYWLTLAEQGHAPALEVRIGRSLVETGNETPIRYYRGVAKRHFLAGRFSDAVSSIQKAVDVNPHWRSRKWSGVLQDMARYRRAQKEKRGSALPSNEQRRN